MDPSQHVVSTFDSTIQALAAQRVSKLRAAMMPKSVTGIDAYFERLAPHEAAQRTTRLSDTVLMDAVHSRRRVVLTHWYSALAFDPLVDDPEIIVDLQGPYINNTIESMMRAQDDIAVGGFENPAQEGRAGVTSVAFPATQIIPHAGAGMTLTKLLQAREMLKSNHVDVDNEAPNVVMSATQTTNMLGSTQVTSQDFNTTRTLGNAEVNGGYLGNNYIASERLATHDDGGTTIRHCYMFMRSGMGFATSRDLMTKVSDRNDKNHAWQVYAAMSHGATRIEDVKVVRIECAE